MQQNTPIYLSLAMMYPLFIFLSFFIAGTMGGIPPLSAGALLDVFTGTHAPIAIILSALIFLDLAWFHLSLMPSSLPDPKKHLILLVIPEVIAVIGFLLAFITHNPWICVPYVALGFANYAYAYARISSYAPKS